jgi:hypothetical protein
MLFYSSAAHREAHLDQMVRARMWEMLPDYIRTKYPEFTPEQVANVLAAIAIGEAREP